MDGSKLPGRIPLTPLMDRGVSLHDPRFPAPAQVPLQLLQEMHRVD
jgi:hypothetical protein